MKATIKRILGPKNIEMLLSRRSDTIHFKRLVKNFLFDLKLYYKHSNVFKIDTFKKIEAKIILDYHSLEKGFLFSKTKVRYGQNRVQNLLINLKRPEVIREGRQSQVYAGYLSMVEYYELHQRLGADISDYFPEEDYKLFKSIVKHTRFPANATCHYTAENYFQDADKSFDLFSLSRKSVRDFTGEKVPLETIHRVIEIAKTAPSVCNRQSVKVYITENKDKITKLFKVQGGFTGYEENVSQLLTVVSDRNYFYTVGERNQLYIDGGLFLMNLLYALHFHKVAACPANWGMEYQKDIDAARILNLPESEKIICMIPIGYPAETFKTTLSLRRENEEILKEVF